MPRILKEFPAEARVQRGEQWDEWLDGKVREFEAGPDFQDGRAETLRNRAINAAKTRGLKVRVAVLDKGKRVVIQSLGPKA